MFEDSHVAQAALEFLSSNGSLSLVFRVLGFQAYTIIPSKFIFDVNKKTLKIVVGFSDWSLILPFGEFTISWVLLLLLRK